MKQANDSWMPDAASPSGGAHDTAAVPAPADAPSVYATGTAETPVPLVADAAAAAGAPVTARPAAGTTASGSLRATAILLAGYAILITGNGLLGTLISLRLIAEHSSSLLIGIVQSAYYVGFMAGAMSGGSLIGRVGHHRAFVTFAAVSSCCALGFAASASPALWVALRLVMGFCLVGIFTVIESWLHQVASNALRARVFSAYLITNYLGVGTGQFLLGLADPASFALFSLVSALFSASLIPVTLAGHASATPATGPASPGRGLSRFARGLAGLKTVAKWAPLGVCGCLAAGLLNSCFYTMQPVFMSRLGYSVTDIAHFMGFALLAALLPQWPVARLADRFERRAVIVAITVLAAACSLLLFLVRSGMLVEAASYLYVSVVFSLYGVVTSYVNDCVPADQRLAVSGGLLLIFSLGASAGPALASASMALTGPGGLYLFTAIVTALLAGLTLRSLSRG
jgi:MFS family permease